MKIRFSFIVAIAWALAGCRQDMYNQPRYKPLAQSEFFADDAASRTPPPHTIARGRLEEDAVFFTGATEAGALAAALPGPITAGLLKRGQERYGIFCAVCHGATGDGHGMIVRRGFPAPQSYHSARLREAPPGYFFYVMTHGYGVMYSYAARVPAADRWAIVAYIKALQLSQQGDRPPAGGAQRGGDAPWRGSRVRRESGWPWGWAARCCAGLGLPWIHASFSSLIFGRMCFGPGFRSGVWAC